MSKVYKNEEVFTVKGDRTVTVSVTFSVGGNSNDRVAMENAAEALAFYVNNGIHKSWAKRIEVK